MAERPEYVIVGAGLAGAKAAEALRAEGFDGRIVLVGAEDELPYERPPLSKDHLRGETDAAKARVHPDGFYEQHEIELLLGVGATALRPGERELELAGGRVLRYDRLLLAMGAVPRRLPVPGAELAGVHALRSLADAAALREALTPGARLVVVGGGWIGCEVAASARQLGADVTMVEQWAAPLERLLGAQLGSWFAALHRRHGVELVTRARAQCFIGDDRVRGVRLADGRVLDADCVVVGVGAAPHAGLAASAGLRVDDGVTVDDRLRTSAPGILAAGDVAGAWHPRYGRHVRVEHWSNALHQGTAAGRSMLGLGGPYDRLPSFFSDQYDAGLEYVGLHAPGDRLVVRGSLEDDHLQAFWLGPDGRVTAGLHVNDWDAIGPIRQLVEAGEQVDAAALAATA